MYQISIYICVAFSLSTIHTSSELNLTNLMDLYINSCGEEGICKKWPGVIEYPRKSILSRCPPCSCEDTCFRKNTCCPDKYFERKITRYHHSVFQWSFYKKEALQFPLYSVIDSCPEFAEKADKCNNPASGIEDRNFVTSLVSNYTYYNIFCAFCNGERESDIVEWDISVDWRISFMFFMESKHELLSVIKQRKNFVIFTPPPILQNKVFPVFTESNHFTDPCPDGGDLQIACSSSYVNVFRVYKNVFCYLCKLKKLKRSQPFINTCPKTVTNTIQKLCRENSASDMTYPYRNFYCFLCNIPTSYNTGQNRSLHKDVIRARKYVFLDFSSNVTEEIVGQQNNQHLLIFQNNYYNDVSILNKIWNTVLKQDASPGKTTEFTSNQVKPLLTNLATVYPHRICNQGIFSDIIQNVSMKNCECSFSCLFKNPCSCCLDTALMYQIGCVSNAKAIFSKQDVLQERKLQVVKNCYEGTTINTFEHREKIKHLCEEDLNDFEFPVLSNKITYKNIFCFLCNTNYTIANGTLITDPYEMVDINILCNSPLQFDFFMRFSDVLEQALRNKCDITYDDKNIVLCHKETSLAIKRTNKCKGTHALFDARSTENWRFEKTGSQSQSEFCQLCKPIGALEVFDKVEVCDQSNVQYVMYRNAFLTLPDEGQQRLFHSYRNIFCSHCVEEYNASHQRHSSLGCIPVFGGIRPRSSRMMRDLFVPMMGVLASTFKIKSEQSSEYGCYPGRVLEDGICRLVIAFPRQIKYHLHILCKLSVSASMNDTVHVLSQVKSIVFKKLLNSSYIGTGQTAKLYILARPSDVQVNHQGLFYYEAQVTLIYYLVYYNSFDRDAVENTLLQTHQTLEIVHQGPGNISFVLKGITFSNISETLTSWNLIPEKDYHSFRKDYNAILIDFPDNGVIVSRVLTSRLRIINFKNIEFDHMNYRIIVKDSNEVFYLGEYVVGYSNQVKVYNEFLIGRPVMTGISQTLDTLTNIVNAFSIVSLVLLFVIYLNIPDMRTLSGRNIMNTTFSFLGMQLTYTIANALEKETLSCKIVGVLLHYFWLCLCCCMFICCLHMFLTIKGFINTSFVHGETFNKVFVRYVLFCYMFPLTVVSVNLFVSYYIDGSIGYGIKVCFVEHFIQNIATFIAPLVSTCISNVIIFTLTIIHITKCNENRSELVIFCKFFCLTGAVWILQVIDSFMHISFFSFVVTFLTSSQGIFIFASIVFSSQVMNFFKSKKTLLGTQTDITAVSSMQTDNIEI